jgi:hypothetical protein
MTEIATKWYLNMTKSFIWSGPIKKLLFLSWKNKESTVVNNIGVAGGGD